jgi:GT2 family glycosyltransferase
VVAVLDASPDDSERILLVYRDAFIRRGVDFLVLKNRRNVGQAATINRGVRHASSELVMVLNDDDILFEDSVWLSLQHFELSGAFALLGGSCVPFSEEKVLVDYGSGDPPRQRSGEVTIHPRYAVEGYSDVADFNITHSGMTFLKEAWRIAGGYRRRKSRRLVKFSDRDFQFRMNCYFPTAVLDGSLPLAFWRKGSSVDKGLNS